MALKAPRRNGAAALELDFMSDGFTPEQRRAVRMRDVSVALSAGAGCGKTFVLTERFLSYLDPADPARLEPADIRRLVAITFTDRAAREMRDRIRQKCFERLVAETNAERAAYLAGLIRALDSARINTIHSYCGSLLRSHAVEAGIDPGFTILEQAQADAFLSESLDDSLRRLLSDRHSATLDLLVDFDLPEVRAMVTRLISSHNVAQFAMWLERSPEELVAAWSQYHEREVAAAVLRRITSSPAAKSLMRPLGKDDSSDAVMRARRVVLQEKLAELQTPRYPATDVAEVLKVLHENARVQGAGSKKAWGSELAYEQFRDAAGDLRESIKEFTKVLEFDGRAALAAAVTAQKVLALAAEVAAHYGQRKQDAGVFDFNDLLARTQALLSDPAHPDLARRLSTQIELLLVDEFQDTDPLQVEIVSALCGDRLRDGKLFFVGDYKQSIYRFRGADPQVFRRLRDEIPAEGRLPLTLNFRSQPAILNFVNALFADEMRDYEALRPSRPQVSPLPCVEFLWAPAEETKESKETLRRREADWIARRLRAMIDSQEPLVWDTEAAPGKPACRALKPGDIAILFRALSDVEYYEDALRRYGLDYYLVGGKAFYAQQEVFDLLNLLRTLNSTIDQISLAGVLRSPFFSLSDETLYWLAQHPQGMAAGLFAPRLPAQLDDDQGRRARFAAATLSRLREQKDRLPIAELINEALAETGYDALLLGEFLGQRKLANLRKLIEQARTFDRSGMFTLTDFIAQLAGNVAKRPDEALAATQPEDTDVVRLMTIHQAKGLEFPLVVVPDMERATRGPGHGVEFTPQLGPMVRMPKDREEGRCLTGYDIYTFLQEEEELAEIGRLLYVATTRAADYLLLSSAVCTPGKASGPWMQLLARHFDLTTGMRSAPERQGDLPSRRKRIDRAEHAGPDCPVRVTSTRPPLSSKPVPEQRRQDLASIVERAQALAAAGQGTLPPHTGPIAPDLSARRQYSFSRLSGELYHPLRTAPRAALEEATPPQAIDPLGLGTLVHAVLAEVNFGQPADLEAIVRRRAPVHLEDNESQIQEALDLVRRFLESPRAAQLASAAESFAELEFLLAWPPESSGPRQIYLSGFIDRLARDSAGRWHLLDFKTNRVQPSELDALASRYEMQMLVYALAAEQILKSPPASVTLHFVRSGLEHQFAWGDPQRKRVRELVDQGIAAASVALAARPVR